MKLNSALLRNSVAGVAAQILNMGIRFLQVPFFLHVFGVEGYGKWLILTAISSLVSVGGFGVGVTTANDLSLEIAGGRRDAAIGAYSTGLITVVILSTVIFTSLLAWWLFSGGQRTGTTFERDSRLAIVLIGCTVICWMPCDLFVGLYRATEGTHLSFYLIAFRQWMELGLMALSIFLVRPSFSIMASCMLISASLFLFIYARCALSRVAWLGFSLKSVSLLVARRTMSKGLAFQVLSIGQGIMVQGNLVAVESALGPVAVVLYGTARTLVGAVLQIVSLVNSVTWPEFSRLIGSSQIGEARTLHRSATAISILVGVVGSGLLLAFGLPIYRFWTSGTIEMPPILFLIFMLPIILTAFYAASAVVLSASNHPEGMAYRYFLGAFISVIACYIGGKYIGIYASAAAGVIVYLISAPFVVSSACAMLNDSTHGFYSAVTLLIARSPRLVAITLRRFLSV